MLNLSGLVPTGALVDNGPPRLRWTIDGRTVETDFERFRPVELSRVGPLELQLAWQDFGDMALDEPFFQFSRKNTKGVAWLSKPFKTDWATAEAVAATPGLLPFNGVVFHMARTGSTLIHRLLSCTGKVHSLSEVGPLDRILQATENWPERERNRAMHVLCALYRRPRRPAERHFVTKMTDSGASIRLPQFRAAFPKLPWIFVYREPLEVMASVLQKPTGTLDGWYKNRAQSSQRLSMPAIRDPAMWPPEFVARSLRRFCRAAVDAANETPAGLFLAVPYARLPDAIWETIAPHFGIELTDEDIEAMRAEARYSSKKTDSTEFRPDSDKKRDEATPMMREMAERFVVPVVEELKRLPQA